MSPTAGLAFKPQHFAEAIACPAAGLWFEIHAENYMVDGGPRLAMLDTLHAERPISVHGVGLSLASTEAPDPVHLNKLARLVDRCDPFLVSEHLAWCRLGERCFPDLLPFPRSNEALRLIARNIDIVQNRLRRPILIENPSLYMELEGHEWSEPEFLGELAARTGCGLVVDLNNIVVSGHNIGFDPTGYLAGLPGHAIGEYHLAGHSADDAAGLLIDSHDCPVAEAVWSLFDAAVRRFGARPTLIERDGNLPPFGELLVERARALEPVHA
ncbi:DUF692 domain-containing protein [Sphingomonas sp. ID1715]|uniref:MNIO family bufferin maturase n=1 Tax=Sphingomonas sp. ID1715 TaxID=1656898 RepID=UPI001489AAAA|nr:DUF692 domain-containing protein [Sphingomonas sp. ID1715]NNM76472.1 DUF692 domain-containing protein [Sphingomonas sp. ID1715]